MLTLKEPCDLYGRDDILRVNATRIQIASIFCGTNPTTSCARVSASAVVPPPPLGTAVPPHRRRGSSPGAADAPGASSHGGAAWACRAPAVVVGRRARGAPRAHSVHSRPRRASPGWGRSTARRRAACGAPVWPGSEHSASLSLSRNGLLRWRLGGAGAFGEYTYGGGAGGMVAGSQSLRHRSALEGLRFEAGTAEAWRSETSRAPRRRCPAGVTIARSRTPGGYCGPAVVSLAVART
jgi:hypothetical protein